MRNLILISFFWSTAWAAIPKKNAENFPEGERLIYSRLAQSFQKGDFSDVLIQKKLLEEKYPQSVHLDHAYFIVGAMEYQQDHLGEALKAFDQVVNRFSQSSKRSSALYAMGLTYKKLNLPKQSEAVFKRIMDLYPGSPDSQRAWLELRLLSTNKSSVKKNPTR